MIPSREEQGQPSRLPGSLPPISPKERTEGKKKDIRGNSRQNARKGKNSEVLSFFLLITLKTPLTVMVWMS